MNYKKVFTVIGYVFCCLFSVAFPILFGIAVHTKFTIFTFWLGVLTIVDMIVVYFLAWNGLESIFDFDDEV